MATVEKRLILRRMIDPSTGCWIWLGARNNQGYGVITIGGHGAKLRLVHRVALELRGIRVPDDLPVDHLCRRRECFNPEHLEVVTTRENTARTSAWEATKARHAAKTHCPRGHEYTPDNTRHYVKQGYQCRACRACETAHSRLIAEKQWKGLWRKGHGKSRSTLQRRRGITSPTPG